MAKYVREIDVRIATSIRRPMKMVGRVTSPPPAEYEYAGGTYYLTHIDSFEQYAIYVANKPGF